MGAGCYRPLAFCATLKVNRWGDAPAETEGEHMAAATKAMETVTIESITTNERGWTEVQTAEYDEPLVTKESKVKAAAEAIGSGPANVAVNVKTNGNFVNRYLNDIVPSDGEALPAPAPSAEVVEATESRKNEREQTQLRIEAQWAVGRAVELHVGSGGALSDLLDSDKFAEIQTVAETLRTASRALADKG